jgi:hypothetical protein
MNKHFEDARYYLSRAAETATAGVKEELEPVEQRFREATGREEEQPDPGRLDRIQSELEDIEQRAEGEARRAVTSARGRIERYRSSDE